MDKGECGLRITSIRLHWIQQVPKRRGGGLLQWFDVQYKLEGGHRRFKKSAACPIDTVGVMKEIAI